MPSAAAQPAAQGQSIQVKIQMMKFGRIKHQGTYLCYSIHTLYDTRYTIPYDTLYHSHTIYSHTVQRIDKIRFCPFDSIVPLSSNQPVAQLVNIWILDFGFWILDFVLL